MKKGWHAPTLTTLDVRLTENGEMPWYAEGTIVFKPNDGNEDIIHSTHS